MKINKFLIITSLAIAGCSTNHNAAKFEAKPNEFWWPNKVNLSPLRAQSPLSNPYGANFDYAKEFAKVDINALKADIKKAMTTSQDWWPADYGNYGPFFIRMAWHSAGTYRLEDGRGGAGGGQQRFEPLNSWPDNANLDKARRLLWPVKQKYGKQVSWADLMVLSGNVALESMGFKTLGFAGGRADDFEPDLVYWGPENKFMQTNRFDKNGKLHKPLGATTMGLIYVNPEGPNGSADPIAAAAQIRETFGRMAMNDEETVALIAGGHTFGKTHGAHKVANCVGVEPAAADIEAQGMGWKNKCGKGNAQDTITSGLEGSWTSNPTKWTIEYLQNLFAYDWVKTKSPAGAIQFVPAQKNAKTAPNAHDKNQQQSLIMLTTDLSLKEDKIYREISQRFLKNPKEFEKAFASAWFKLTHRDMGSSKRYVGKDAPKQVLAWQDALPKADYALIDNQDAQQLKAQILQSNLTISQLVKTAWASAASYRKTDMRGGTNGARLRLDPQKNWAVNNPQELNKTLAVLEKIQKECNQNLSGGKKVSLADVIVLAGNAAVEKAAKDAGVLVAVPFKAGRVDASQAQTDVKNFAVLEPKADGFRNYYSAEIGEVSPVNALIDRAYMLDLTVPEMTALVGGMRVLGANADNSEYGIFTKKVGVLSNDFFVNLLDVDNEWKKDGKLEGVYEARDRKSGKVKWNGTPVDLVFGSNSELRAVAEVYAARDGKEKLVHDFVKAWVKVMGAE